MRFNHAMLLYRRREYERAIVELKANAEVRPTYYGASVFLALTYTAAGRPAEALAVSEEALQRLGPMPPVLTTLGQAHAALGDTAKARAALARLDEVEGSTYVPAVCRAIVLSALGDADAAFAWLDRAADERYSQLMFINVDPAYDALRSDARFKALVKRLHLE
jgi:tetratricopeptide (TPR) repeat protein